MKRMARVTNQASTATRAQPILPNLVLAAFIAVLSCVPVAKAQYSASVQGEIVELPCYMVSGDAAEYQACALRGTPRTSVPLGVVTDAGELFLLVNQSADPAAYRVARDFVGERTELTGRLVSRRGVAGLIVEAVEGR